MERAGEKAKGVIRWRIVALVAVPIIALGVLALALGLYFNHRDANAYDTGGADPSDFSREEEAVRARIQAGDAALTFGPHYRFTKLDRDRKRRDVGFRLRMATLRRTAAEGAGGDPGDVFDPPAVAIRVRCARPHPLRGSVVEDHIYFLDGDRRFIISEQNRHGDDWVRWVIPDWQ
jgi:hypothetical protein